MKIPCSYGMTWRPTKSRSPPVKEKKGSNIKKTLKVWKKRGKRSDRRNDASFFLLFLFQRDNKKKTKKTKRKVIERREWVPYVHQLWTWDDTRRNEEPWPDGMRNNKRRASSYRSSQAIIELFFFPLFFFGIRLTFKATCHLSGFIWHVHVFRELIERSSSLLKENVWRKENGSASGYFLIWKT